MLIKHVVFENERQVEVARQIIEKTNDLLEGGITCLPALSIQADGERQANIIRALFPSPAQIQPEPQPEQVQQPESVPAPEPESEQQSQGLCKNCGKPAAMSVTGERPLSYCSITCSEEYRRKHSTGPVCLKCGAKLRKDNTTGYCSKHTYIKNLTGVKPGRKPNTSGKAGMITGTCSICHRENVSITSKGECMSCIVSGARNRAEEKYQRSQDVEIRGPEKVVINTRGLTGHKLG